jgi:hypothetical protein
MTITVVFAQKKSEEMKFSNDMVVNGSVLKKGTYKVIFEVLLRKIGAERETCYDSESLLKQETHSWIEQTLSNGDITNQRSLCSV